MYIDKDVIEKQIKNINILDYLEKLGYTPTKISNSYKLPEHGGLWIDDKGEKWNCFAAKKGGGIIQIAMYLEDKSWQDAIYSLADKFNIQLDNKMEISEDSIKNNEESKNIEEDMKTKSPEEIKEDAKEDAKEDIQKELLLPEKDNNSRKLFAYLNKARGIDNEFIQRCLDEHKIYQSKEIINGKERNNIIWKIFDDNNNVIGASWQSTLSYSSQKGFEKGSVKSYFDFKGTGDKLYIFESPIDMLSYLTLAKRHNSYDKIKDENFIATFGLNDSSLEEYLKKNENIKELLFCYDNDIDGHITLTSGEKVHKNHGQEKAKELCDKYSNYICKILTPSRKDYNDVLKKELGIDNTKKEENINEIEKKDEEIKKDASDIKKTDNVKNTILEQLYEEERKLTQEAKKIIQSIEEIKKSYETTITKILEVKDKIIKAKEEEYKEIIKNSSYTMIKEGIDINIVYEATKVEKEKLKEIRQEVINQKQIPMYGIDPEIEAQYSYTEDELRELDDLVLEKT